MSVQEFIGEMGMLIDTADLNQGNGAPPVERGSRVNASMQNPRGQNFNRPIAQVNQSMNGNLISNEN